MAYVVRETAKGEGERAGGISGMEDFGKAYYDVGKLEVNLTDLDAAGV